MVAPKSAPKMALKGPKPHFEKDTCINYHKEVF